MKCNVFIFLLLRFPGERKRSRDTASYYVIITTVSQTSHKHQQSLTCTPVKFVFGFHLKRRKMNKEARLWLFKLKVSWMGVNWSCSGFTNSLAMWNAHVLGAFTLVSLRKADARRYTWNITLSEFVRERFNRLLLVYVEWQFCSFKREALGDYFMCKLLYT